MKTIEVKLYSFDELSEEAKEKALSKWAYSENYFWGDDAIKSIEKFMEHFNCSFDNYEIDWCEKYRNSFKITIPEYMENISEDELKEYILSMGSFNPNTLNGHGDCKFTGYCADEDVADGARKAFFAGERNLHDILYAGYESWYTSVNADYEYQQTIEFYADHCEMNDYYFTENGEMY
ncbi:MAG: hypothetical protein PHN56_07275 [Candidatus Nanoarchaeia archaeon]|nr:hypothetical protein [Candidatus Nanoarchaeia archaeon]